MKNPRLAFTHFRVWEVVVPARADILAAPPQRGAGYTANLTWPDLPIHLVEGQTECGVTALGEAARGRPRSAVEATLRSLLGVDLRQTAPPALWSVEEKSNQLPSAFPFLSWEAADDRCILLMETLWLDAVGKSAGLPAHVFFGGAIRREVPVDFWANRPDAAALVRLVKEAAGLGCRGMKLKCDAAGDVVDSLVTAAPDLPAGFRFTLDPMCAWRNFRQALPLLERLGRSGVTVQVEDPFPHAATADWRRLQAAFPFPLIWHARDEAALRLGLDAGLADGFNLGCGSSFKFRQYAERVAFAGVDCWQGSGLELGVIQSALLHAASAARNCVLPSDLQSLWVREHTLVTPVMEIRNGFAQVPNRPGLGVGLDQDALGRYTRDRWELS